MNAQDDLDSTPVWFARRDLYAGGLVVLLGIGTILYARCYAFGSLMHMGPGFFPLILGVLLVVLGALIAGTAAASRDVHDQAQPASIDAAPSGKPQWFAWGCIVAGPMLFIVLGEHLGMAAGVFACVFVAALGDRSATWKSALALGLGITVFGVLLFSFVLRIPFPIFRWAPL